MAKFVQVAVPEEHVWAVYRMLLDLEDPQKDSGSTTSVAQVKTAARTARTAESRLDVSYTP